jgi:hypothetical protein
MNFCLVSFIGFFHVYIDHPDACMHITRNSKYNENDLFVVPCRNTNFV